MVTLVIAAKTSGRRSLNQHHRRRRQSLDRAPPATQLAVDVSTVDQQHQLVRKFVGVVHAQTQRQRMQAAPQFRLVPQRNLARRVVGILSCAEATDRSVAY